MLQLNEIGLHSCAILIHSKIRNVWYQLMNAVKDEEVQRKGFVKVVFNINSGEMPTIDKDLFFKGAPAIFEALPFRMAAMHFCYDDPMIRPVLNLVQRAIGRQGRVRFRSHFGKCIYLVTHTRPGCF